jgi:hypothetical protein
MTGSLIVPLERIERAILLIRGHKVMLDKDLALLYRVTTSNLNKAVSRNIDRFPADFMFQISKEELHNLKFHFGTSSWGGTRKLPRAFTEQGLERKLNHLEKKYNLQFKAVFDAIRQLMTPTTPTRRKIGFRKE